MKLSNQQQKYVSAVLEHAPALSINTNKVNYSRAELRQVSMAHKGKKWIPNWITHDLSRRVSRGVFAIPEIMEQKVPLTESTTVSDDMDASIEVADDMVATTTPF
jgi:hypothetical protein